jgi:tetratricopeptide (TPR) repeat protein
MLMGCASALKVETTAAPVAAASNAEPMGDYLTRAQALGEGEGEREQARLIYRAAAKAYPADKRPWLRLAQSYFDARDYGNAVLAAQEVAQRDASDVTAQSLLAISGLRISTAALSTLRSPNHMNSTARQEAEQMAQSLRTILGEPVLVPTVAEPEPAKPLRSRAAVRPTVKARTITPSQGSAPLQAPGLGITKQTPPSPFGALN